MNDSEERDDDFSTVVCMHMRGAGCMQEKDGSVHGYHEEVRYGSSHKDWLTMMNELRIDET